MFKVKIRFVDKNLIIVRPGDSELPIQDSSHEGGHFTDSTHESPIVENVLSSVVEDKLSSDILASPRKKSKRSPIIFAETMTFVDKCKMLMGSNCSEDHKKLWVLLKTEAPSSDNRFLEKMSLQGWYCIVEEMENDPDPQYIQRFCEFESFVKVYLERISSKREAELFVNQNLMPVSLTADRMNDLVRCLSKWPLLAECLHPSLVDEVSIYAVRMNNPMLLASMLDLTDNLNITVSVNKLSLIMYAFKTKSRMAQDMLCLPVILNKQDLYHKDVNGQTILDYAYIDGNPKFIAIFENIKPPISSKPKKLYTREAPSTLMPRPMPQLISNAKEVLFRKIRKEIKAQLACLSLEGIRSLTSSDPELSEINMIKTKFKPA